MNISSVELLGEIMRKKSPFIIENGGKKELFGVWREYTIGIGNDHTATILIDDESFNVLLNMLEE